MSAHSISRRQGRNGFGTEQPNKQVLKRTGTADGLVLDLDTPQLSATLNLRRVRPGLRQAVAKTVARAGGLAVIRGTTNGPILQRIMNSVTFNEA